MVNKEDLISEKVVVLDMKMLRCGGWWQFVHLPRQSRIQSVMSF